MSIFSPLQRSFKFINGIAHGEFGGIVNEGRGNFIEGLDPSIVESASQVVDGIASNECKLTNGSCVRGIVLDDFLSSMRIDLNSRGAAIWQTAKAVFKVSDVLIGPFELQP